MQFKSVHLGPGHFGFIQAARLKDSLGPYSKVSWGPKRGYAPWVWLTEQRLLVAGGVPSRTWPRWGIFGAWEGTNNHTPTQL